MVTFCRFPFVLRWLFVLTLSIPLHLKAQDGKALFSSNCASCHAVNKDLTGPALQGATQRIPDKKLLKDWVRNNKKVLAEGNPYFTELYNKWNKVAMNNFPSLTDEEIDAIFAYVDTRSAELAASPTGAAGGAMGATAQGQPQEDDDLWMYVLIALALLGLIYFFGKVNRYLAESIAAKKGETLTDAIPVYRDKRYWVIAALFMVVVFGVYLANKGMYVALQQNYQPEQPIFFSHRVHASINKINCQYCHSTVEQSRHALIPSVNVCMNCHKAINEYAGEKLYTEEGVEVDGSAEIKKLYAYANFEPGKPWDPSKGNKPIEWKRIHNLPDHVKFNHAQHVAVGGQECTTCHGQIQEMDEVYQYNTLAMGWCVNCHRQTEVKFTQNKFYDMYKDLHQQLSEGKIDKVTVEQIGGLECQKCHY